MSNGRMHFPDEIHLVTNRCEEGRFYLLPTPTTIALIFFWFAKALVRHGRGLRIYAFCFLSNHFHILCRDTQGTLATFMEYFQCNLARSLNREMGRPKGRIFQGNYDDQIIEGERIFWQKYTYVVANAVKAGLVKRTKDWKGPNSLLAALTGKPIVGKGLNRTRLHNASRGNNKPPRSQFVETYTFELEPPPSMANFSPKDLQEEIGKMVRQAEDHYLARRGSKPILGMAKVMAHKPTHKPKTVARRPRKRFACDILEREIERLKEYKRFIGAYKTTFHVYRRSAMRGRSFVGEWPEGSYPPGCKLPIDEDRDYSEAA